MLSKHSGELMFKNFKIKQLALPLLLVAAVLINKWAMQPTTAKPANAEATSFSAERAMAHVRKIATEPHPVGTAANKRVRDDLVAHLTAAGLEVERQSTQILDSYRSYGTAHQSGQAHHRHSAAYVNNVIARLKGSGQKGKALALMSHYDSVYYGPGASDDAAGTAVLLETLRALQSGDPLKNDVIFLITDAEEVGLFGAQAFFEKHRWADDIGLVLNFEARGSRGPVSMFQTSPMNDKLIGTFSETVNTPFANSLTATIYREMPNDTDLSISLKAGVPGMNFAFIDGFYDYHTKGDNPENLSIDTLQHMGDQALTMTRAMGNQPLPLADSEERVFFDFLSLFMVSYPLWVSYLVALAAVAALSFVVKKETALGDLKLPGFAKAFLGSLVFIIAFGLIIDLLFLMIGGRSGDMVEGRRLFALADEQLLAYSLIGLAAALAWFRMMAKGFTLPWVIGGTVLSGLLFIYEPIWIPAAAAALLTGLCFLVFRKPVSKNERLYGALTLYLLAAVTVQFLAAAGSYLFIWPILLMAVAIHLYNRDTIGILGFSILALVGVLWLSFFTEQGYSALGVVFPGVIAVPFGLLLILMVPTYMIAANSEHRIIAAVSGAAGLALVIFTGLASGFTERHNQPTEVFYLVDAKGNGQNYFGSRLREQDEWSSKLIKGDTETVPLADYIPGREVAVTIAPAPRALVEAVSITDAVHTGGKASFTVKPGFDGDIILLSLSSSAAMSKIVINDEFLQSPDTAPTSIRLYYFAVPDTGLKIDVETEGDVSLHAAEVTNSWPVTITRYIPKKPAHIMRAPYRFSDNTISSVKQTIPAAATE
jgi:hypothetical protein